MIQTTYDYKNVYLIPRSSVVNSRDDVDLSVQLMDEIKLDLPIVASPMKGITNASIISSICNFGGIGIIHRFQDADEMKKEIQSSLQSMVERPNFGVAIGLDDNRYKSALDYGACIICVDVANGYIDKVKKFCNDVSDYIRTYSYDCLLMSGNVVTIEGVRGLTNVGVNLVRIGIGTGNLCSTRQVTGVGCGQVNALQECRYGKPKNVKLVADGGIRNSGDAVKALAAGADLVMLGSILGRTYESSHNGVIYGMASRKLQEEYYHSRIKSVEGLEQEMTKDVSIIDFIPEFAYGMRSAFTYLGASNIQELQKNAVFVEIR